MTAIYSKRCLLLCCFACFFSYSQAQLWNKVKNRVTQTVENKVVSKSGDATNKALDKSEEAVVKSGQKKSVPSENSEVTQEAAPKNASSGNYKNYDFVAGDKIIFQPDLSQEPDAELPARFIIKKGSAEIQSFEGEKVLHLQPNANTAIEPLMSSEQYLPDQFTLEFDMMLENDEGNYFRYASDFMVSFTKMGNENFFNGTLYPFTIVGNSKCSFGKSGLQNFSPDLAKSFSGNTWHHIAIYVRKNVGKAYIDAERVSAVNSLPIGANNLYIKADRYGVKIKNFRLAEGGDDKYKKIVTDGKFITHGILFDVNKFSIKPESMGTLNEIVKMMKEHIDLNFEIDGYTDSDGKDDQNLKLSQARADAVKAKLMSMGIDGQRLSAKGFGEAKPIDKNDSAEGKANNRRVEFVKK